MQTPSCPQGMCWLTGGQSRGSKDSRFVAHPVAGETIFLHYFQTSRTQSHFLESWCRILGVQILVRGCQFLTQSSMVSSVS